MSLLKKIQNHPALIYAADITEICKPLKQLYGIDYFSHVNVDNKGKFSGLGTNPAFVKQYVKEKYFNCDSHLSELDNRIEYIIQDSVHHSGDTRKLFNDCKEFGVNHVFTILQREEDSINAYHFATSKKDKMINEIYLKHLPVLQHFISHFKERVHADKNINKAYEIKFDIDETSAMYESDRQQVLNKINLKECLQSFQAKRYHLLDEKNNYITEREFECIIWLHLGKTADEIAGKLKITERTVRAHINSIKHKLNCRTLFQLGEKISQSNLTQLIDLYV